jgi:uridine kinase
MSKRRSPITIGVAGGTGSGKTTIAKATLSRVGFEHIAFLQHDAYYLDQGHLPLEERAKLNFDHPDTLDNDLLVQHVKDLRDWKAVEVPVYDFTNHRRTSRTRTVSPQQVVLVEGILILAIPALRELMDVRIYVDTDADLRFIRRLQRDIAERGRTMESVVRQYLKTVRPMHLDFVEPSKRYANVIIPEGGFNEVAMDMVVSRIQALLAEPNSSDC